MQTTPLFARKKSKQPLARTPKLGTSNSELPTSMEIESNENPLMLPSSAFDPNMISSYTLPQWLVPERYKDKQSSQNTTQTRVFSVPLPQVSIQTKQSIRTYLMKTNPPQRAGVRESERKLKQLKEEEKQASSEAKAARDKLAQALLAKSEKIKKIRKEHELKTTRAIEELETKIRHKWQKEDIKLKEEIKEECKLEYEKKFEDEMVYKRKREQEEDEKEESYFAAKKARGDKEETATATDKNGVVEGETNAPTCSKVEALEKKQANLKEKMEKLSEKKSEMIWLLKQVIKQEALKKMKMKKLKKATDAK